jgi:tRNA-2-methylthio-N6-dimethylallyladenosine synthase
VKVYIKTFGCQMNEYDSAKIADVLRDARAMEQTDDPATADLILFNTCSVREKAQEKVFTDLGRVKHLKLGAREVLIGVGGCVASQEGASIVARAPYVDLVFGPQTLHRLPQMIDCAPRDRAPRRWTCRFRRSRNSIICRRRALEGASAFVSVMEGCSKYCTFCVVPYTRGEEVSRGFEDVLAEVAELAQQGVREITLLGQNVNAYRAPTREGESADLALLLEYVAEIPGIERVRFTTSHPKEFSQRLIDAFAALPQLAGHVHLPVQAGSDAVLAAMKRSYTVLEYKSIVRRLRARRPDISISSDFIVGFPGETEADFEATMTLIEEVGFDQSFSFVYSRRPGTPAAALPDTTPQAVKLARLARLQAKINEQAGAISRAMLGTQQQVLVEGRAKRNADELSGRTGNNRVVNFPGPGRLIGRFVDVTITGALPHSLRAEIVA